MFFFVRGSASAGWTAHRRALVTRPAPTAGSGCLSPARQRPSFPDSAGRGSETPSKRRLCPPRLAQAVGSQGDGGGPPPPLTPAAPRRAAGLRHQTGLGNRRENGAPARAPPPRAAPLGRSSRSGGWPRPRGRRDGHRSTLAPAGTAPPPPRACVSARTDLLGGGRRHLPPPLLPPPPLPPRRGRRAPPCGAGREAAVGELGAAPLR